MSKGPNDRSIMYFDGGFKVVGGNDTIWNNITTTSLNVMRFERSGEDVFTLANFGELKVSPTSSATSAALDVQGYPANQDLFRLYDKNVGEDVLKVTKTDTASGWAVNMVLRNEDGPQATDEALRLTHDVQSDTPQAAASLLSMGYTGASPTFTYAEMFKFVQGGSFYLMKSTGANILWDTDGGGSIGASGATRPANVYAATTVNAAGSVLKTNAVDLGPAAATDKTITALQSGSSPYIKYVNGSGKWQFSNNGVDVLDFGTSNVATWDDLYASDTNNNVLRISTQNEPLTIQQIATKGNALKVTRNLAGGSTDAPVALIENANGTDDQAALNIESSSGGPAIDVNFPAAPLQTPGLKVSNSGTERFRVTNSGTMLLTPANYPGAPALDIPFYTDDAATGIRLTFTGTGDNDLLQINGNAGGCYYKVTANGPTEQKTVDGRPFTRLDGTPYTHQFGNICTASSLGETIRVEVEGNTRWIPCFIQHDMDIPLGGATTLDGAYNNDSSTRTIDVDDGSVLWQINGDYEFGINNETLAFNNDILSIKGVSVGGTSVEYKGINVGLTGDSGDSSVNYRGAEFSFDPNGGTALNQHAIALQVNSGGWTTGLWCEAGIVSSETLAATGSHVSHGMTTGAVPSANQTNVLRLSHTSSAGSENAGAIITGAWAEGDSTSAATDRRGFYADDEWAHGVYSLSKSLFQRTISSVGDESAAVTATINSDGISSGNEFPAVTGAINDNAGDSGAEEYVSFLATTTTAGGGTKTAFECNGDFDKGLDSYSKSFIQRTIVTVGDEHGAIRGRITSGSGISSGNRFPAIEGIILDSSGDSGAEEYVSFFASTSDNGGGFKYGFYTSGTNYDYSFYGQNKAFIKDTNATVLEVDGTYSGNTGAVDNLLVETNSGTTTGLSNELTGVLSKVTGNAGDADTTYYGYRATLATPGTTGSTSIGYYATSAWDYGFESLSPVHLDVDINYQIVPSTSGNAHALYIEADSASQGAAATGIHFKHTNPSGVTTFDGLFMDGDGDDDSFTNAINIDSGWGYGLNSNAKCRIARTGITAGINYALLSSITSGGITGALNNIKGILVDVDGSSFDTAGKAYGIQVNGFSANGGSLDDTYGVYIGSDWEWGLYSTSVSKIYVSNNIAFPAMVAESYGVAAMTAGQTRQAFQGYPTGNASDSSDANLISFYAASDTTGSATRYGVYAHSSLDYAMYADDAHIEIDGSYDSSSIPFSGKGYIDLNTSSSGLTDATRYGIKVDHTGHASSTGANYLYNFYADASVANASEVVTGFYAGNSAGTTALDAGFWAEKVGTGAFTCTEGQIVNDTHTDDYTHTAGSTALFRGQTQSDGITSDGWRTFNSTYVRDSGDSSSGRWYGFLSEVSGTSGSAVTTGFRAQSGLDVGFSSYADYNQLIRNDDVYSGTNAVLDVQNNDNDTTGGATAAIKASNNVSSTSAKVLEISSAYSSTTEGTRRIAVLSSYKENRRALLTHTAECASTNHWSIVASDISTNRNLSSWRAASYTGGYRLYVPLFVAHLSTLSSVLVRMYFTGTASGTQTSRARCRVYRTLWSESYSDTAGYIGQAYASTATGVQSISVSCSNHTVDHASYRYFLEVRGPTAGSRTDVQFFGGYYYYRVYDLLAPIGL